MIKRVLRDLSCPNALDCPKLYELDDGRLVVRGDRADAACLTELALPSHTNVVNVPTALLPEVRPVPGRIYKLAAERLVVRGDRADAELLTELGLPDHETVVVVPASLLTIGDMRC